MGRPHQIDAEWLVAAIDRLSEIGRDQNGGVTRLPFSLDDMKARDLVSEWMRESGLSVVRDPAGNDIGTLPGSEAVSAIAVGSHTDTVPNGGRYDGALGVLVGIAAVRALKQSGTVLRHPIEVINFVAEEATLPGGTVGSRAMTGALAEEYLSRTGWDDRLISKLLLDAGIDPVGLLHASRAESPPCCFVELHIEQGATLEQRGIQVGVVEGIVGIRRFEAEFPGSANHAGTTPMASRDDALRKAAPIIESVASIAVRLNTVGTVGTVRVVPNAPNVIPGHAILGIEFRALESALLDEATSLLDTACRAAGGHIKQVSNKAPVRSDPRMLLAFDRAVAECGVTSLHMPSGAGHDAMCMADICPQAMLFVPSKDGISHAFHEYSSPEQCITGANVLLQALIALDSTFI
ncbi:MAG: Zn-dependent hydrolase [Spirochaetaceae bacterium]|nr:MAG: Zn-dependent hydrolase [Spirochaetaceae bacterium]